MITLRKEIKGQITDCLKMNSNDNSLDETLWNVDKDVIKGKCISLNKSIR